LRLQTALLDQRWVWLRFHGVGRCVILIRWFQGKQQCCGVSGWEPIIHLDSFFIKFILLISASGVGTVGNIPHW